MSNDGQRHHFHSVGRFAYNLTAISNLVNNPIPAPGSYITYVVFLLLFLLVISICGDKNSILMLRIMSARCSYGVSGNQKDTSLLPPPTLGLMTGPPFLCLGGCNTVLWSRKSRATHYNHHPPCREQMLAAMEKMRIQATSSLPHLINPGRDGDEGPESVHPNMELEETMENIPELHLRPGSDSDHNLPTSPLRSPSHVTIEEIEDEDTQNQSNCSNGIYTIEEFPGAGDPTGVKKSARLQEYEEQATRREDPWAPFASYQEWEFAHWLMKSGMSQTEMSRFFKLQWVRE